MRLKAAAGRLKIVSEVGIGALLPLAPTLEKLVSLLPAAKPAGQQAPEKILCLFNGAGVGQFIKSSQLDAIRAIINIKAIIVEVPDLVSDQCDQL